MKRPTFLPAALAAGVVAGAIVLAGSANARVAGDCPGGTTGPALSLSPAYWPSMLPAATVGQHYSVTITVSGGSSGQYQWELSPSDLNGTGLTMDHPGGRYGATLTVSGTPTAAGGPYAFGVGVADTDTPGGQICAVFYPTGGARYEFKINGAGSTPSPTPTPTTGPSRAWKEFDTFGPLDDTIGRIEKDLERASRVPPLDSIEPPVSLALLPKKPMLVPADEDKAFSEQVLKAIGALSSNLQANPSGPVQHRLVFVERALAAAMGYLETPAQPAAAKIEATKLAAVEIDNAYQETRVAPPAVDNAQLDLMTDAAENIEAARVHETEAEIAAGDHRALTFRKELNAGDSLLGEAWHQFEHLGDGPGMEMASNGLNSAIAADDDARQATDATAKVAALRKAEVYKDQAVAGLRFGRTALAAAARR